jgi:COMPASS component SWD3
MDSCLRLWDYVSGTVKKTYSGHKNEGFSVGGCFGSVDGEAFIAAPSEDGEIVLWDVKSKDVVQRIQNAHEGVCFWVDVWQDVMVSAGQDGKIKVYKHKSINSHDSSRATTNEKQDKDQDQDQEKGRVNGSSETPAEGNITDPPIESDDVKMED